MIGSTFSSFHSPGVSHQFQCCFSSSFSTFEDRRVSFKSCPFSRRFVVLASCYPLKLFLVVQFFSSIRSISRVAFPVDYPEAIFSEDFFVLSFQIRSPIILYSCLFVCLQPVSIPEFVRHLRRFICVLINSRLSPHSNISVVPMHHLSVQHPFPTVLSLQWALTQRSFPRILPDSSNSPGDSRCQLDVMLSYCFQSCNSFHPSGVFQELLSLSIIRRPSFRNISLFQVFSSVRSYICTGSSFKHSSISSQSLSFRLSKSPQAYLII